MWLRGVATAITSDYPQVTNEFRVKQRPVVKLRFSRNMAPQTATHNLTAAETEMLTGRWHLGLIVKAATD